MIDQTRQTCVPAFSQNRAVLFGRAVHQPGHAARGGVVQNNGIARETCFLGWRAQVHVVQPAPKWFRIVVGAPVAGEFSERIALLVEERDIAVHDHATRSQKPVAFAHNVVDRFVRGFMKQNVRHDEVERLIGKVRASRGAGP